MCKIIAKSLCACGALWDAVDLVISVRFLKGSFHILDWILVWDSGALSDAAETLWEHCGDAVGMLWGRCGDAVGTLWDAVGTPWGRCGEAVGTLWG